MLALPVNKVYIYIVIDLDRKINLEKKNPLPLFSNRKHSILSKRYAFRFSFKNTSGEAHIGSTREDGWGWGGAYMRVHACSRGKSSCLCLRKGVSAFSVSSAINQCPGQPGREHFQTHLQQIMPAIPPSPRDRKASLMNHCPFRSTAEWSSPCCVYRVLLCLPAKTATKIGCKENGIKTLS